MLSRLSPHSTKTHELNWRTSDIPELTADWFKGAIKNPFYKPVKKSITVRLDSDTLQWLKEQAEETGQGYQTLLNAILRKEMLSH